MACEFELILNGADRAYLDQVADLALDEIARLDGALNRFDPTSEVSYLNAYASSRPVIVSPDLFEILRLAQTVSRETHGAFDVTAGPLIDLRRRAERRGDLPCADAMPALLELVGMEHVMADSSDNSVRFSREGVLIDLGAIGKGYAVRRAIEIAREYGVKSALVSAGGSTVCGLGAQPDGEPWRIGIRHPSRLDERVATVYLHYEAMSTSGGPRQRDEAVEERFEHVIDPVTGGAARTDLVSATAITQDPVLSDALSTAFYLRGKAFALDYCRAHEGVRAVLVEADDESGFLAREIRGDQ